jgi:branched-chain amino acid transport system permease protein
MPPNPSSARFRLAFFLILGAFFLLPLLGWQGYRLRLLALVFLWVALAGSWNLMSGYTGYIDFGPVAYFGIGSYCTALLMIRGGVSFFPGVLLSGLACAGFASVIGWVTLRLQGAYFAIATFAVAEAMKQVILEADRVTGIEFFGGSHGLTLPPAPSETFFYYLLLSFMGLVVTLSFLLSRSKIGYGLRAVREGEGAAELCGVPTLRIKMQAYMLSSSLIGCLGGIEAYWLTYIIPDDVFNVMRTIQMVIMTLLGGMGTILGPVIGGSFLTLISEYLGARLVYDYLILVGGVIILVIILLPRGVVGEILGRKGKRWWLF